MIKLHMVPLKKERKEVVVISSKGKERKRPIKDVKKEEWTPSEVDSYRSAKRK